MNKELIDDFLINKGFDLVDQNISEYFGDCFYIYSNGIVNFRLVSDRSIESIDVCSTLDIDSWFDLSLIKKMLINNEKDFREAITLKEYNDLLKDYFVEICDLFNKENYPSTKKKLDHILG